jgi:hypothetical protein
LLLVAHLKNKNSQLKARVTDWTNACYQEKIRREELKEELKVLIPEYELESQLRTDGERDLLLGMQTVKNLNEENQHLKLQLEALTAAVEPIAEVILKCGDHRYEHIRGTQP